MLLALYWFFFWCGCLGSCKQELALLLQWYFGVVLSSNQYILTSQSGFLLNTWVTKRYIIMFFWSCLTNNATVGKQTLLLYVLAMPVCPQLSSIGRLSCSLLSSHSVSWSYHSFQENHISWNLTKWFWSYYLCCDSLNNNMLMCMWLKVLVELSISCALNDLMSGLEWRHSIRMHSVQSPYADYVEFYF